MDNTATGSPLRRWFSSHLARLLLLSLFVLLLLLPIGLISDLVREREATPDEALEGVTHTWGGGQRLHFF